MNDRQGDGSVLTGATRPANPEPVSSQAAALVRAPEAFGSASEDWPHRPHARGRRVRRWIAEGIAEEARFGHGFLWLPVFMAAGAATDLAAPHDIALTALLVPFAACAVIAVVSRRSGWRASWLAIAAAAYFAGLSAAAIQVASTSTVLLDGPVVTHLTGRVLARENRGKSGWRYLVDVESTADPIIRRPPHRVRLVARGRAQPIPVGGHLSGLARLLPPSGPVLPGGYDFAFNSYFGGIGAVGFFYGPPHRIAGDTGNVGETASWRDMVEKAVSWLRDGISARIRTVLSGDEAGLASALIVAERGAIADATVSALRDAGLAHILAISGLHMALVAGTVFMALRLGLGFLPQAVEAFPVKKIAAVAALVVATGYLVLSGASVSTQRAWIMLSIVLVAILFDRAALTLRNVAIAALVVLTINPAAVVGPSFQMSFAATIALVAGYSALRGRRFRSEGVPTGFRPHIAAAKMAGAIAFTSLTAGSATAIFAAFHFYKMATMGVFGNLLAMPVISFVVMPFGLLSVLAMPYGLQWLPLKVMGFGLHLVIAIAYEVQSFAGSAHTGQIPPEVLVLFVAGFCMLSLMRSPLRLVGAAVIAAAIFLEVTWMAPRRPDILVAEDGTLVGLPREDAIATNMARPPSFVFEQWLGALAERRSLAPETINIGRPSPRHRKGMKYQPPDPSSVAALRKVLVKPANIFTCNGKAWCAIDLRGEVSLTVVNDLAYLAPACDFSDIVVAPAPIRLDHCRSGALLMTGRTLRRTGALAIHVASQRSPPASQKQPPRAEQPSTGEATGSPDPATSSPTSGPTRLTIVSALGGTVRPWTVQRYYDWRSDAFDFAVASHRTEEVVLRPTNDNGASNPQADPGS